MLPQVPNMNGGAVADLLRRSCRRRSDGMYAEADLTGCYPRKDTGTYLRLLGQYYHSLALSSGEKRDFIYSFGLLVAAELRLPGDEGISRCSHSLWESLLLHSHAVDQTASLSAVVEVLKSKVLRMRESAAARVGQIPVIREATVVDPDLQRRMEIEKIEIARDVFASINQQYIDLMSFISAQCVKILFGKRPPFEYAHVAVGSPGRSEATPFSDLESAILLPNSISGDALENDVMEKFRWYSVVFQVFVIALGETPVRCLAVPLLNDFYAKDKTRDWFFDEITKCGIQFDGNMPAACVHPLSRLPTRKKKFTTELIATVERMSFYQDKSERKKNGYHLAQALVRSCFVAGSERLHQEYRNAVVEKMRNDPDRCRSDIHTAMQEHDPVNELCQFFDRRNIKKMFYRGITVMISNLGMAKGVEGRSCFEVIEGLEAKGVFTAEASHNAKYAVAIACETRTKLYLKAGEQIPETSLVSGRNGKRMFKDIVEVVGKTSACDFFDIGHSLWRELHPHVVESKPLGRLSVRRNSSLTMIKAISDNLLDEVNETMSSSASDPSRRFAFIYLAKTLFTHMIRAVTCVCNELDSTQPLDELSTEEKVVYKKNQLQKAFSGFKTSIDNVYLLGTCGIPGLTAANFFSADLKAYNKEIRSMKLLMRQEIRDERLLEVVPDIFLLVVFLGGFVSAVRQLISEYSLHTNRDKIGNGFSQIEAIKAMLGEFKNSLPKFRKTKPDPESAELVTFDDGLFGQENLRNGLKRMLKRIETARQHCITIESLPKFLGDVDSVIKGVIGVKDWSVYLPRYIDAVVRDIEILIADMDTLKAQLLGCKFAFVNAAELLVDVYQVLLRNIRNKGWFYRKTASVARSISDNYFRARMFEKAAIWFKEELKYRLKTRPEGYLCAAAETSRQFPKDPTLQLIAVNYKNKSEPKFRSAIEAM